MDTAELAAMQLDAAASVAYMHGIIAAVATFWTRHACPRAVTAPRNERTSRGAGSGAETLARKHGQPGDELLLEQL